VSPEPEDERGFVVVDRRGEDRSEEGATSGEASGPPPRALPRPDFASLVISLGHSALFHLGLVPDPQSGERGERNLALCRQTIDTIEMLQEKTRGNRTPEEDRLLDDLLYDLRMRFVEASK
jgi:Domain of unknown function (DUF1844)